MGVARRLGPLVRADASCVALDAAIRRSMMTRSGEVRFAANRAARGSRWEEHPYPRSPRSSASSLPTSGSPVHISASRCGISSGRSASVEGGDERDRASQELRSNNPIAPLNCPVRSHYSTVLPTVAHPFQSITPGIDKAPGSGLAWNTTSVARCRFSVFGEATVRRGNHPPLRSNHRAIPVPCRALHRR